MYLSLILELINFWQKKFKKPDNSSTVFYEVYSMLLKNKVRFPIDGDCVFYKKSIKNNKESSNKKDNQQKGIFSNEEN